MAIPPHQSLQGVVVLELGTSVAGPFGAQILAELGAEVIKVEKPGTGDDARFWGPPFVNGVPPGFLAINRNKKSVTIDLKDAEQAEALRRLVVERVDVVLQNMRPGLVGALGLSGAALRELKPSLIYCNLAAYGASGPLAGAPGYDPLMQAFGGVTSLTGNEGESPVRVGPAIIDQGSGMWSAIGILAALHRRAQTGEGCEIDTSLYETALSWISPQMASYRATGRVPSKMGSEHPNMAPYGAYRASDGWIVIGAGNDNLFRRCATALEREAWLEEPEFRTNPDRVTNRVRLNACMTEAIAEHPRALWIERLTRAGVPCAPLLTLDEIAAHPQFDAVDISQTHADSDIPLIGLPLRFDGVRPPLREAPPPLGAHTHEILGAAAMTGEME